MNFQELQNNPYLSGSKKVYSDSYSRNFWLLWNNRFCSSTLSYQFDGCCPKVNPLKWLKMASQCLTFWVSQHLSKNARRTRAWHMVDYFLFSKMDTTGYHHQYLTSKSRCFPTTKWSQIENPEATFTVHNQFLFFFPNSLWSSIQFERLKGEG